MNYDTFKFNLHFILLTDSAPFKVSIAPLWYTLYIMPITNFKIFEVSNTY